MNNRLTLYFLLAVLPALTQSDAPPADRWGWFKWVAIALYQGLLAVKAYQSNPETKP